MLKEFNSSSCSNTLSLGNVPKTDGPCSCRELDSSGRMDSLEFSGRLESGVTSKLLNELFSTCCCREGSSSEFAGRLDSSGVISKLLNESSGSAPP